MAVQRYEACLRMLNKYSTITSSHKWLTARENTASLVVKSEITWIKIASLHKRDSALIDFLPLGIPLNFL